MELVEQSLDVNLTGNKIRYRFVDTPILEGITIHEAFNSVIVLVATVSSIHRLCFPHPDIIHDQVIAELIFEAIKSFRLPYIVFPIFPVDLSKFQKTLEPSSYWESKCTTLLFPKIFRIPIGK